MNECVLIVDDDPEIVGAIAIVLEREGYSVRRAYNGLQAVEQALDPAGRLIVIDVMMPKSERHSLVRMLRKAELKYPVQFRINSLSNRRFLLPIVIFPLADK